MFILQRFTSISILFLFLLASLSLTACDNNRQDTALPKPVKISAGDECHLCGMIIARFPGPKGQAFVRHHAQSLKFCSTVDLFSWYLQPDTAAIIRVAYVHDMGAAPSWDRPSDEHYVDIRAAWYVAGHDQPGAMGHTLASFKHRRAAEAFIRQHGGRLLSFEDIDLALLATLQQSPH